MATFSPMSLLTGISRSRASYLQGKREADELAAAQERQAAMDRFAEWAKREDFRMRGEDLKRRDRELDIESADRRLAADVRSQTATDARTLAAEKARADLYLKGYTDPTQQEQTVDAGKAMLGFNPATGMSSRMPGRDYVEQGAKPFSQRVGEVDYTAMDVGQSGQRPVLNRVGGRTMRLDPQHVENQRVKKLADEALARMQQIGETGRQNRLTVEVRNDRPSPNQDFTRENALADDYRTATRDIARVANHYTAGRGAFEEAIAGNPAAQQRVVFSWMKILDPPSTVRPTEQASVENAQGVPDRIRNIYNKLLQGTVLAPEAMRRFTEEMEATAGDWRSQLEVYNTQYRQRAIQHGVRPENIITDYFGATTQTPKQPTASAPPGRPFFMERKP